MNKDMIVLLAARAARLENQDAIDAAIVNMLADPKEVECKETCVTKIFPILRNNMEAMAY